MDGCWWRARVGLFLSSVIEGTTKRLSKQLAHCTDGRRILVHRQPSKFDIQYGSTFKTLTLFRELRFARRSISTVSLEASLAIVLPLLLILAGDVELNPGPTQKGGLARDVELNPGPMQKGGGLGQ